jgi:hypothetical protein
MTSDPYTFQWIGLKKENEYTSPEYEKLAKKMDDKKKEMICKQKRYRFPSDLKL